MDADGFVTIDPALKTMGIDLDPDIRARISRYVALLEHWNRRINLVGARDPGTLWQRHVLDCLMLERLPADPSLRRWLDVGSGAGLPGVLIALAHPERQVWAVESVARKATFLTEVKRVLALSNFEVLRADVHRLADAPDFVSFDAMVCRAFAPLSELMVLGTALLRPGGELWAMKGIRWREESEDVPSAVSASYHGAPQVHAYRLQPGGEGVVLVYRRTSQPTTAA